MAEPRLSQEAKHQIRKYLATIFVPAGTVGLFVAAVLGWFVNDWGRERSYNEAMKPVQTEVMNIIGNAANAVTDAAMRDAIKTKDRITGIMKNVDLMTASGLVDTAVKKLWNNNIFVTQVAGKIGSVSSPFLVSNDNVAS